MMALGLFDAALKGKPLQMVSCDGKFSFSLSQQEGDY